MTKDELVSELTALYWSAQAEKERAIHRGNQAGGTPEKIASVIQRSVEDIEHGLRTKLAHVAIEFIHSNIE